MDEIFRFVALRPPQRDLPAFTLRLAVDFSPFLVALRDARAGPRPREAMIATARAFEESGEFIAVPADVALHEPLLAFADGARGEPQVDLDRLNELLREATGENATGVSARPDFPITRRRLSDSVIALLIAPRGESALLPDLSHFARALDLVERLAREEEDLAIPGAVEAVLREALIVPPTLLPLPPATPPAIVPPPAPAPPDDTLTTLRARQVRLRSAIRQLLATDASAFQHPPARPEPASEPPRTPAGAGAAPAGRSFLDALVGGRPRSVAGVVASRPDESGVALLLRPEAFAALDEPTRTLLQQLDAVPTVRPITVAVARLESELRQVDDAIALAEPLAAGRAVVRVGRSFVATSPGPALASGDLGLAIPESAGVPETVGSVRPAGVGSLLLVRQQIKRYEAGELAHVENYLRGESRERATRRLTRREESFTVETETTQEEERDLQTTERFELQQEVTKTVQQDQSFNVGVSVSAGYGPYFQIDANTEFSTATSTTETAQKAFSYAKEITNRSAARMSERVRKEQTIRTLEEFEETNRHAVDNTNGDGHVIGIYQWLEKVLEAQIYDYGARLFFDFMVPEPAAFLHRALEANEDVSKGLVEPPPFTTRPQSLDQSNYRTYVHQYRVSGVQPPPPLLLTVSRAYEDKAEAPGADFTKAEAIDLPSGYSAYRGYAVAAFMRWGAVDGDPLTHTFVLDNEQGTLPLSLATLFASSYAVNVEVLCQRDPLAYDKWQLETHDAIMQAYLKMKADYEERLAQAAAQEGVQVEGRSPLENRLVERGELKKHCISLLTAQHYDSFSAIVESEAVLPRIDFDEAEAEGRFVRFFEQAFEWENMAYVFYPYFWGRKQNWLRRVLLRDVDPVFAEFLKAGSARVVTPVRPGFERAVLHFLDTGQVWAGADLPQIGSPLYVDILEEIRERLDAPGAEVPVFEPWDVRLPTTLVRLAPNADLPEWRRDRDGVWVPVEPGSDG